jgi:hypothetical protein
MQHKDYIIKQKIDEFYYRKCSESTEYRNITKEDFLKEFGLHNIYYNLNKSFPKISKIVRTCDILCLTLKDLKEDCKKFNGSEDESI